MAVMLVAAGEVGAYAAPQISFVAPTPDDGAIIEDTSVEIRASIIESALADVTFNWNGTDYALYDNSLVLMFNFDNVAALGEDYTNTAGSVVKDLSGAGNDGLLSDTPGIPAWIPGKYGGAFDFTGNGVDSGQSILVLHSDSLNPYDGDFAIALWILTKDAYDGDILRKGSTKTASTWYKLEHAPSSNNNKLSLNFNTTETDATIKSAQAYNDYQWHFVVAQRKGNQAELWIDGALDETTSISGSISNNANLAVGSKDTQNDDFINSALDEVRIYMRSFSKEQIEELYCSNLSKYDIDKWTLYVNQSNLTDGATYTYQASATNVATETSSVGPRILTRSTAVPRPIVLSPNGGESFMVQNTHTITYKTLEGAEIDHVKIEYSTDNGQNWQEVDIRENTGFYEWDVPPADSNDCLVRVSDSNNPAVSDTSDDVFTIFQCQAEFIADLNADCYIDLPDFAALADDSNADFLDVAALADEWLKCANPFDRSCDLE